MIETLKSLTDWIGHNIDFPAVVFMLIFGLIVYILWKIQQNPNNSFDFADLFRGDDGKPSNAKLMTFLCFNCMTWGVMYMLVSNKGTINEWIFLGYGVIWSGQKIVERGLDVYAQKGVPITTSSISQTVTPSGNTTMQASTTQQIVPPDQVEPVQQPTMPIPQQ